MPVPFHRRVMLAVFILAFLFLAPAVVFYTAGYRWNSKKGVVERNGTLILDTIPAGGTITLNGEQIPEKTPITLQNVAPGTYRIKLELAGYSSWEKTLDVRPERVTFVNNIKLWPRKEASLVNQQTVGAVSISPNKRFLATLEQDERGAQLVFYRLPTDTLFQNTAMTQDAVLRFAQAPTGTVTFDWNDASSAVVVKDQQETTWLGSRSATNAATILLPQGVERWNGGSILGVTDGGQTEYVLSSGRVRTTPLAQGVLDENESYQLRHVTSSPGLFLVERGHQDRRYVLPNGAWTFADTIGSYLFMTDGHSWLGFDPTQQDPVSVSIPADEVPSALRRSSDTALLSRGGGELWLDIIGEPAQLLVRNSEALRGAAWSDQGNSVIYATAHDLIALDLDPRDGRLSTALGSFDDIQGFTATDEVAYIAGTKGGVKGLWSLGLE